MFRFRLAVALLAVAALMDGAVAQDAKAPPPPRTAMFTSAEVAQILSAISDASKPHSNLATSAVSGDTIEPIKPIIPNIYLSAVADYGAGHWTVWANGQRIMPGRQTPGFQIVAVRDDRVDILVEGDTPAHITLRPHQTWLSVSKDVVEGIIP